MSLAQGKVASLFVEFRATVNSFAGDMAAISREVRAFDRILYPIGQRVNTIGLALTGGLTVPITALSAFVLKAGIDFETAFAGVKKTVKASGDEIAKLRAELLDLSTTVPTTAVEFAHIAQAAGQLGVKTPDIKEFTRTMAELGEATNLSATEAAKVLARFINITQLPSGQIHNLASSLTALGNTFAADEAEIAQFALRMASTGEIVGLSSAEILGFAAGLKDVGVRAEAGATAIARVFIEIDKAVLSGGTKLKQFAAVAGVSSREFAESFKTKPAEAMVSFIEGLKKIEDEGGNVFNTLDALKLSNVRIRDTLLSAAEGSGRLRNAVALSSEEFTKNAALTKEVGERHKTTASHIQTMRNQVEKLGISIFDTLAPSINNTLLPALQKLVNDGIKPAVEWFNKLPESSQHAVEGVLLFAAAIGPAILIVNKLVSFVGGVALIVGRWAVSFGALGASIAAAFGEISAAAALAVEGSLALGTFIAALTIPLAVPWWLTAATYAAPVVAIYKLATAYRDLVDAQERAGLDAAGADNATFAAIDRLKKMGIAIDTQGKSMQTLREEVASANIALAQANKRYDDLAARAKVVTTATKEHAASVAVLGSNYEAFNAMLDKGDKTVSTVQRLKDATDGLLKSIVTSKIEERALADAVAVAQKYHISETEILRILGPQLKEVSDRQKEWGIAIDESLKPLVKAQLEHESMQRVLKAEDDEIAKEMDQLFDLMAAWNGVTAAERDWSRLADSNLKFMRNFRTELDEIRKAVEWLNGNLDVRKWGLGGKPIPGGVLDQPIPAPPLPAGGRGLPAGTWEDYQRDGQRAIDSIIDDISKMFTESIAHGKKFWEAFKDLGKTTLASVFNTTLKEILHSALDPFKEQIGEFIDTFKQKIKDAVKDFAKYLQKTVKDIVDQLADYIGKTFIGKFFDKIATAFDKIISIVASKLKDVVKEFGSGIAAAIAGAFIANKLSGGSTAFTVAGAAGGFALRELQRGDIIGAAVGAAVAAGAAIIGTIRSFGNTHNKASEFVDKIQNPFGKQLSEIIDANNALFKAGKQTVEGAAETKTAVLKLWEDFTKAANEFAEKGSDQATVVGQAFSTLDPIIQQLVKDIDSMNEAILADPLNPMYDSFRAALKPADDLNTTLDQLAHAFSLKDIVSVYAEQIISAAEAQRKHGYAVTGMVAILLSAANAYVAAQNRTNEAVRNATKNPGVSGLPSVFIDDSKVGTGTTVGVSPIAPPVTAGIPATSELAQAIFSTGTAANTPFEIASYAFERGVTRFVDVVDRMVNAVSGMQPMAAAATGTPMEVYIDVTAPIQVVQKIDRRAVRNDIMPEWIEAFKNGIGGARREITEMVKKSWDGV